MAPPYRPITLAQVNASVGYRRILTLAVSVLLLGLFVFLGNNVQVPYVALGPGLTVNTPRRRAHLRRQGARRQAAGAHRARRRGEGRPHRPRGRSRNLTTVSVIDGLSLFDALGRWASRKYSLVPRETQYPPGRSTDEVREQNAAQMSGSG